MFMPWLVARSNRRAPMCFRLLIVVAGCSPTASALSAILLCVFVARSASLIRRFPRYGGRAVSISSRPHVPSLLWLQAFSGYREVPQRQQSDDIFALPEIVAPPNKFAATGIESC